MNSSARKSNIGIKLLPKYVFRSLPVPGIALPTHPTDPRFFTISFDLLLTKFTGPVTTLAESKMQWCTASEFRLHVQLCVTCHQWHFGRTPKTDWRASRIKIDTMTTQQRGKVINTINTWIYEWDSIMNVIWPSIISTFQQHSLFQWRSAHVNENIMRIQGTPVWCSNIQD